MKLNLTRTEINNLSNNPDITLAIGRRDYAKELLVDNSAMYDLLKKDVYETLSNISMSIADLEKPSLAILEDKEQVIILIRKIRELIGEDS